MDMTEKTLSSKRVFDGRLLQVEVDDILLPNGKKSTREVIRHPGGVCVLPVDDDGRVLFVRQYRYPYGQELLELPAGKLEAGEEPLACAARELEEETGYTASKLYPLGTLYPSPGCLDEVLYLYYADELTKTAQHLDEDEFLSVQRIALEEALAMVEQGALPDAKTQVALLKYQRIAACDMENDR